MPLPEELAAALANWLGIEIDTGASLPSLTRRATEQAGSMRYGEAGPADAS